jgi:hypothetical protein
VNGTKSVTLDWFDEKASPYTQFRPNRKVRLYRDAPGAVPPVKLGANKRDTSWIDTTNFATGTYKYTLSFIGLRSFDENGVDQGQCIRGASGSGSNSCPTDVTAKVSCSLALPVGEALTECNDNRDNADTEDSLADERDPGCHTDGNPYNARTYQSQDTSEANPYPDLRPVVTLTGDRKAGSPLTATYTLTNKSTTFARLNSTVLGWRNVGVPQTCTTTGIAGTCFAQGGATYRRMSTLTASTTGNQVRTVGPRLFTPSEPGTYEVCAVADITKTVAEGVAGEANNVHCARVVVTWPVTECNDNRDNADTEDSLADERDPGCHTDGDPGNPASYRPQDTNETHTPRSTGGPTPPSTPSGGSTTTNPSSTPTITGPLTLTAPARVRKGTTADVTWSTGGRTGCAITATNGNRIAVNAPNGTGTTVALRAGAVYTITCTGNGTESATAEIQLLPTIREI